MDWMDVTEITIPGIYLIRSDNALVENSKIIELSFHFENPEKGLYQKNNLFHTKYTWQDPIHLWKGFKLFGPIPK